MMFSHQDIALHSLPEVKKKRKNIDSVFSQPYIVKSTWSLSLSGRFMGAGHRGVDVLICHIFHCGSIHPRSFFRVAEYRKVFPYLRISLTPIYAMLFGCSCVRLTICLITQEILCASQAHKCVTWLLGVPWREWNSKSIETSIGLNNCILLLSGNVDIP